MQSSRVAWLGLCLALACLDARAQQDETQSATSLFASTLGAGDFAALDAQHAELEKSRKLTDRGEYLADARVYFGPVMACEYKLSFAPGTAAATQAAMREACWKQNEQKMELWRAQAPQSQLVGVGWADLHHTRASAYAAKKTPDAFRLQQAHARKSWEVLERVPVTARGALWYARALRAGGELGWGSKRTMALLAEGAKRYPDRVVIYQQAAVNYSPGVGGTPEEVDAVVQFAMRQMPDADQPMMYARIYDALMYEQGALWQTAYGRTHVSWPLLRRGLEDIHRRYPVSWNLNRLAQHACAAFDISTLVNVLARIGAEQPEKYDDGWWRGEQKRCRDLARRGGGVLPPQKTT